VTWPRCLGAGEGWGELSFAATFAAQAQCEAGAPIPKVARFALRGLPATGWRRRARRLCGLASAPLPQRAPPMNCNRRARVTARDGYRSPKIPG